MSKLYFRLNLIRDKGILNSLKSGMHGVALEAHIVELYPTAITTFMSQFQKSYFLDPVLYKFEENFYSEFSEKRWAELLTEKFGLTSIMASHPSGFSAGDILEQKNSDILRKVVGCILDYQRVRLPMLSKSVSGLSILTGEDVSVVQSPEFLVAPYIVSIDWGSLNANMFLARLALDQRLPTERVFVTIAINKEFLFEFGKLLKHLQEFTDLSPDGFLLWVCDFRENEEDSELLKQFEKVCKWLRGKDNQNEVVNLFGGYYSAILNAKELISGSVQGVGGVSEFRNPFMVGGGGQKRFYVPIAHQTIGVDLADDLIQTCGDLFKCDCSYCGGNKPSVLSVDALGRHAVSARIAELNKACRSPADQITSELRTDAQKLVSVRNRPLNQARPDATSLEMLRKFSNRLGVWADCLESLAGSKLVS